MLSWSTLFFAIGLVHVVYFLYAAVMVIRRNFFISKKDLVARYSQGPDKKPWALVTGASDGIGAEYCIQLARDGFNICLVSRTLTKLQDIEKKVKEANPKVETCVIQFDFEGVTNMADFQKLRNDIESNGIDVGLLVINAGLLVTDWLETAKPGAIQALIDVNMYHPTALLKVFLPTLIARKGSKSGIVVVSSVAGSSPLPYLQAYSASKAYVTYLTLGVEAELKCMGNDNIDVQILTPNFVATQMVDKVVPLFNMLITSSVKRVVDASLRQMGQVRLPGELSTTHGTFRHEIFNRTSGWLGWNLPLAATSSFIRSSYGYPSLPSAKKGIATKKD